MRLLVRMACLVALVLAAGCGAHYEALQAPPLALKAAGGGQKSIVVISTVGDTFYLKKVGITVFGNDLQEVPIGAWGVDEMVSAKVAREMGRQASVKVVKAPPNVFAPLEKAGPFADRKEITNGIMRGLTAQHPSDLIVLVHKAGHQLGNSNQSIRGLGLLQTSGLFPKTIMHALFAIEVMDAKTLAPVAIKIAQNAEHNPMTSAIRGPHREVDASWWPDPAKAAADQRLKGAIQAMVDQALADTLVKTVAMN